MIVHHFCFGIPLVVPCLVEVVRARASIGEQGFTLYTIRIYSKMEGIGSVVEGVKHEGDPIVLFPTVVSSEGGSHVFPWPCILHDRRDIQVGIIESDLNASRKFT